MNAARRIPKTEDDRLEWHKTDLEQVMERLGHLTDDLAFELSSTDDRTAEMMADRVRALALRFYEVGRLNPLPFGAVGDNA